MKYMRLVLKLLLANIITFSSFGSSILFTWRPNPTSEHVNNYRLYVGTNSGSYNWCTNFGNVTNKIVGGFTNDILYFALTAINTNGVESLPSVEYKWTNLIKLTFLFQQSTTVTGTYNTFTQSTFYVPARDIKKYYRGKLEIVK